MLMKKLLISNKSSSGFSIPVRRLSCTVFANFHRHFIINSVYLVSLAVGESPGRNTAEHWAKIESKALVEKKNQYLSPLALYDTLPESDISCTVFQHLDHGHIQCL